MAPTLVRMVFHDAIDYNNLETINKAPITTEGGVDFCLNNPINAKGEVGKSHNRNLPLGLVKRLHKKLKNGISLPDFAVLGALTAIEESGRGPQVPFKAGRQLGACKETNNCQFKGTCAEDKYLKNAFDAVSFDSAHHRSVYESLGFTVEDQVALQGAHSFGKLQVCAGGFNGIEHGPFTQKPEQIEPAITVQDEEPTASLDMETTWKCRGEGCRPRWLKKQNGKLDVGFGFGDGGFFDRTPTVFDNDYFALLQEAETKYGGFGASKNCCGKIKKGDCHRFGPMADRETKQPNGKTPEDEDMGWCRSDRKGRSHLKSLKSYVDMKDHPSFIKKPYHHGYVKRNILLGGDISLLDKDDTKTFVSEFANSQQSFFDSFTDAYKKVISMTDKPLTTCTDTSCTFENGFYKCGDLSFKSDDKLCTTSEVSCNLIAGLGARGVLECGDEYKLCCVGQACSDILSSFYDIELN